MLLTDHIKFQKSEIYSIIEAKDSLQPSQFAWKDDGNSQVLLHSSGGKFIFRKRNSRLMYYDSIPRFPILIRYYYRFLAWVNWDHTRIYFTDWLRSIEDVVESMAMVDPWSRQVSKEVFDSVVEYAYKPIRFNKTSKGKSDNSAFKAGEIDAIEQKLDIIMETLKSFNNITKEKLDKIEEDIEHLKTATKRVGKKDWVMMFTGTILGKIINEVGPDNMIIFKKAIFDVYHSTSLFLK